MHGVSLHVQADMMDMDDSSRSMATPSTAEPYVVPSPHQHPANKAMADSQTPETLSNTLLSSAHTNMEWEQQPDRLLLGRSCIVL